MKNNFIKLMTVAPALVGASLIAVSPAQAGDESQLIDQINEYGNEGSVSNLNQVTSVNQLRDVSPTDWSYEALRSLVERYGCIVGYPDRTFRGNRALSRNEFAAGLNACMQQMERLIAASETVLKEDIAKLQRLMKEFEAELAALGARVDNLEGRVAFLEDHQFSTTTKLKGEVILALTQEFNDNEAVLGNRVRLAFNSSFTGEDTLITRIASGSSSNFSDEFNIGGSALLQNYNLNPGGNNNAVIDWIGYYTPIKLGDKSKVNLYVAGYNGIHSDYAPTLNPYFEDYDGGNGSLSVFASENPIYRIGFGQGLGVSYEANFLKGTTFSLGYLARNGNNPSSGAGLFNGDYAALAQISTNITDNFSVGFTYVNSYNNGTSLFGDIVGTAAANGVFPETEGNSLGFETSWRISEKVSFSGFLMYSDIQDANSSDDDEIWSYGAGFAFPDLGKEGNLLGIFAGVQPYSGTLSAVDGFTVPVHVEAFYKYKVNDNISITPGIIWVSSPEQIEDENDAVIGTIRTTFSF
jgi:Carbohydrate-selective porin, OprB family/S-layer homology domain